MAITLPVNNWCPSGSLGSKILEKSVIIVALSDSGKLTERGTIICSLDLQQNEKYTLYER